MRTPDKLILSALLLSGLTVAFLVPFVGKAFHMDDPLYLWTAEQIQRHPADFFGLAVNWYGKKEMMWDVLLNPPLVSYYIAAVTYLVGWSEIAVHLSFLVPAIAAILGIYFLSKHFCQRPFIAALTGLFTPVFLISATTVMCDVMMLAFWVWAVFFWVRGLEKKDSSELFLSALLISASALTKYYGTTLVPLLAIYSVFRLRRLERWTLFFIIPLVILSAYQWATHLMYGKGLLFSAGSYTLSNTFTGDKTIFSKSLVGLCFTGGCLITLLLYFPFLYSRQILAVGAFLLAICTFGMPFMKTTGDFLLFDNDTVRWGLIFQFCLFSLVGLTVLSIAIADFWKKREAASVLLLLWVIGTFVFASFINWSCTGRSILPAMPAAVILIMRRMDSLGELSRPRKLRHVLWVIIPAAVFSLYVTWADYTFANTAREASFKIRDRYRGYGDKVWFEGHWGFQYYMESLGSKEIDFTLHYLSPGEVIVLPSQNSSIYPIPWNSVILKEVIPLPSSGWLETESFYSDAFGPLPFMIKKTLPPQEYYIYLVTTPDIVFLE